MGDKQYCVYRIRNVRDNCHYIGSTSRLAKRWQQHLWALRVGRHPNRRLQQAFTENGEHCFVFEIVEIVECRVLLKDREQHYLDSEQPTYNLATLAIGAGGYKHTSEALGKIQVASIRRWARTGERQRASEAQRKSPKAQRAREALHTSNIGAKRSPETRQKISEAALARREQCREIMKARWANPEYRQMMLTARSSRNDQRKIETGGNA